MKRAWIVVLGLAAPAAAQQVDPTEQDLAAARLAIADHDRVELHPGGALGIVGLGQAGNELPGGTVLDRREVTEKAFQLDRDENYRRRLAMFERSSSFSTGIGTVAPAAARASAGERTLAPEPPTKEGRSALELAASVTLVAGLLWVVRAWRS